MVVGGGLNLVSVLVRLSLFGGKTDKNKNTAVIVDTHVQDTLWFWWRTASSLHWGRQRFSA